MNFAYDSADQLFSASDNYSNYTYLFDALGRLTKETVANPGAPTVELHQKFDAASNRTELTARLNHGSGFRDDLKNAYTYDALRRMTRVDQFGVGGNAVAEKRADFAYNAAGAFTSITRYKDTDGAAANLIATSLYTYDGIGRLSDLEHTRPTPPSGGATSLADYAWVYDAHSRVTSMSFSSLVGSSGTSTYSYDQTDQLTGTDHSFQTDEANSYDVNGNRTNTGFTTGADNRITSDGVFNYTYDNEGNRLTRTRISGAPADDYLTEYAWDHRNRLSSVTSKNNSGTITKSVAFEYDIFDRRIEVTIDADGAGSGQPTVHRWIYDPLGKIDPATGTPLYDILLVIDGNGGIADRYLHGPGIDHILAEEQYSTPSQQPAAIGDLLWALADNLGTIRDVIKHDAASGAVVVANHLTYDSFGKVTSETSPSVDFDYGFTGRERDESTGLVYHRARYGDPDTHTWLNPDPRGFVAGDSNLYRSVNNGPTNATDPSGMDFIEVRGGRVFWVIEEDGIVNWNVGEKEIGMVSGRSVYFHGHWRGILGSVPLDALKKAVANLWNEGYGDISGLSREQRDLIMRAVIIRVFGSSKFSAKDPYWSEVAKGCNVGGKSVVNGIAGTVVSTVTLGQENNFEVVPRDANDRAYDPHGISAIAGRAGPEAAKAAATAGTSLVNGAVDVLDHARTVDKEQVCKDAALPPPIRPGGPRSGAPSQGPFGPKSVGAAQNPRTFSDKVADFHKEPSRWEAISAHSEKASRKGARQHGASTQTIYRNKDTGEEIVRHTVTDDRGRVIDDHFRPDYKPRPGDLNGQ